MAQALSTAKAKISTTPKTNQGAGGQQSLQDIQQQYGGRWRNLGQQLGGGDWWRAPRIDPYGQVVYSPQYGWQDARVVKKAGGDYGGLTPQFGNFEQYFMPKAAGTSDPELRAKYGQGWQAEFDKLQKSGSMEKYFQQQMAGLQPGHAYFGTYGTGPTGIGRYTGAQGPGVNLSMPGGYGIPNPQLQTNQAGYYQPQSPTTQPAQQYQPYQQQGMAAQMGSLGGMQNKRMLGRRGY